jgi:hypothetical protein
MVEETWLRCGSAGGQVLTDLLHASCHLKFLVLRKAAKELDKRARRIIEDLGWTH